MTINSLPLAFGVLMGILGVIFYTSQLNHPFWRRLYTIVPPIVLCCFVPAALNTAGFFAPNMGKTVYHFAASWLLPAALFLMTLSIDIPRLITLGWKVLAMFFAASLAIIISAPIVLFLYKQIHPDAFLDDTLWRGFSVVASSWIGGAANQAAMKELFQVDDSLFATMVLVDTTNASLWLLIIFIIAKNSALIDRWLRADSHNINALISKVDSYARKHDRMTTLPDFMRLFGLTFFVSGLASWLGEKIAQQFLIHPWAAQYSFNNAFFWMIVVITLCGILLSLTRVRRLDHIGASKLGTAFIYILIATIGMQIDLGGISQHWQLLLVGSVWMTLHVVIIFIVARIIRAPVFYLCVASNANVGGASSAPIVATAFHPSLAPVGVLLGILGYTIGTIGGYMATLLMHWIVQ